MKIFLHHLTLNVAILLIGVSQINAQNCDSLMLSGDFISTDCFTNDSDVFLTASGGTAPYRYNFNNGEFQDSSIFSSIPPGDYNFGVEDAEECQVLITLTIPPLANTPIFINANTIAESCPGSNDGIIEFFISGDIPPYFYSLTNADTNEIIVDFDNPVLEFEQITIPNLSSGDYFISYFGNNGCFENTSVTIKKSDFNITTLFTYESDTSNTLEVISNANEILPINYLLNGESLATPLENTTGIFTIPAGVYVLQSTNTENCTLNTNLIISFEDQNNDGIADNDEDVNSNGILEDDDTDRDGIPDYLDDDDDNDGVDSAGEIINTANKRSHGISLKLSSRLADDFLDTDGDKVPNHRDDDDDGDGVLTIDEDANGNGDPTDDDIDNSGVADYLENNVTLSITENKLNTEILLYPNPASKEINLMLKNNNTNEISIVMYSINGKKVLTFDQLQTANKQITLDISRLTKGVYFAKIKQENLYGIKKITVNNF